MIKLVPQTNDEIFRGSRPEDFSYLCQLGIKSILCLEYDTDVIVHEKFECYEKGIQFTGLPMYDSPFCRPKKGQLSLGTHFMQDMPKPLLVHCRRGIDRTGYLIAKYRMRVQGWGYEKAFQECIKEGHNPWFYLLWRGALR